MTIETQTLTRARVIRSPSGRTYADGPATNTRRDLTQEEHDAFWTWAAVEVLRHTGIRIEELTELTHHSFVQYTCLPPARSFPYSKSRRPRPIASGCC